MAGTVVLTDKKIGTMRKVTFDWLSTSSGAASYTMVSPVRGIMYRQVLIPDSSTATAPSTDYDVTVLDADGVDVLHGAGIAQSNTTITDIVLGSSGYYAPTAVEDIIILSVTDAGNAKGGKVILYIR
jgi:hypothetical protein